MRDRAFTVTLAALSMLGGAVLIALVIRFPLGNPLGVISQGSLLAVQIVGLACLIGVVRLVRYVIRVDQLPAGHRLPVSRTRRVAVRVTKAMTRTTVRDTQVAEGRVLPSLPAEPSEHYPMPVDHQAWRQRREERR